jgi:hypothetical protein
MLYSLITRNSTILKWISEVFSSNSVLNIKNNVPINRATFTRTNFKNFIMVNFKILKVSEYKVIYV